MRFPSAFSCLAVRQKVRRAKAQQNGGREKYF